MDWNTLWLPTATALGLALLHSIWIGALIYLLVRTLLPFLRNAGQRHNLAYFGLLLLAAGVMAAFYQNFNYTTVCENLAAASISLTDISLNFTAAAPEKTGLELLQERLLNLAPWVSIVYLFGLFPAAIYLIRDQRRVQYLRSVGLTDLPKSWSATIAGELGRHPATQGVKTYLSKHAGEVMTLGFWSPVIVFPVALVNALSPEMARTILLHEIAHLRHYDHWLNYPQQFLRTLFFYHPAAHALCRIIDREREHRCDDWVAVRCQDRRTYATALVTVARTSSLNPSNTLVMSATKTPFTNRIQRLFQGEEQRSGHAAFSLLFVGLLALGHLSFTSLGADAGAVDCLEEQGKTDPLATPAFNPVVIDVDGEEINIPLPEEMPYPTAAEVLPPAAATPEAAINPQAKKGVFSAVLEHRQPATTITPLPQRTISALSPADSLPPPAQKPGIQLKGTAANQPLFIVDGERRNESLENNNLDPADIKSVSVFKGEAAISRFGPEGSNGVVVIVTKNEKKAAPKAQSSKKETAKKANTIRAKVTPPTTNQPLYILDGTLQDYDIDPETIENITVLKGKSASTAYGEDGANGVIVITTKPGKKPAPKAPKGAELPDGKAGKKVFIGVLDREANPPQEDGAFTIKGKLTPRDTEAPPATIPPTLESAPAAATIDVEAPQQTTFEGENNPIKVFPNPATGVVNFRNVPTQQPLNVTVYSRWGEVVRQEKFNGNTVNIQGLPAGNYVIVLTDGTQRWVNQVTVTK